jgi:isopenicillin N synthase-like dioxygenase
MIPVIDLGPYLAARPHAAATTAAELGRALQDVGFFVIVNHGVPPPPVTDAAYLDWWYDANYNAARQRDVA